jgi:hypothetical protein
MPGSRDLGLKNLSAWDGFPLLCARPKKNWRYKRPSISSSQATGGTGTTAADSSK